ncbi:hypothetical protein [Pseudoalteromonas denitrificans]|uniref:Uncharacterized protein n=1 Tax=Pseudoalteromonas denitrificans DSM 6059 TaxID=1123010 RepID=A0A1I1Q1Y2_9GAMM|nr:hypothetical protein [Pseudoalteromonas denitrificans]SFD15977.1 hypothetical protein SAMN02745724_03712 [Pseudoalteromonas denitrificans DSM 6059]
MQKYSHIAPIEEIEEDTQFWDIQSSLKVLLINIFSIQVVFYILTTLTSVFANQIISTLNLSFVSTQGLSYFATNMWSITFVFLLCIPIYIKLKKVVNYPLYLMALYPVTLLLFSFKNSVSSLVVLVLAFLSLLIVYAVNYFQFKQRETQC